MEKDHLRNLGIDVMNILIYIAKYDVRVQTEFACFNRCAVATVAVILLFICKYWVFIHQISNYQVKRRVCAVYIFSRS
jgi:hypothetical protein